MMMMLLKTGFSTFSALIYELQLPLFYFYYMLITVLLRINGLLSKVGQSRRTAAAGKMVQKNVIQSSA